MNKTRIFLLFATAAILVAGWLFLTAAEESREAGRLTLAIVDDETGKPLPARVRIRTAEGADIVPEGAVEIRISKDRWFAAAPPVELSLPSGSISIRVERGKEYLPFKEETTVAAAETNHVTVRLKRWINMRERGFRSGENHLHLTPSQLAASLAVEDLDFGSALQWWDGPRWEPGDEVGLQVLTWMGLSFPCSVTDAEVETPWGWVYMIGLRKPMSLQPSRERSVFPYIEEARSQNALICYHSGWSPQVLVDALLGLVDVVNVCNNLFHRHKFLPRPRYSNLLDVPGFKVYGSSPEETMLLNLDAYYRLLNCGLRLAAGAGSAAGVKSNPAGYSRAYVQTGEKRGIEDFWEGWRRGRNFVTNGPMLFLTVNDKYSPGDLLELPATGGTIRLKAKAASDQPLRSFELIANGEMVGRAAIERGAKSSELSLDLSLKEGAWLAARAVDEDMLLSEEELRAYDTPGNEIGSSFRFGHTSPVYVTVGGRGARVERSLEEAQKILDAFEAFAVRQASPEHLSEVQTHLKRARQKFEEIGQRPQP
jgi:hypothetical protein